MNQMSKKRFGLFDHDTAQRLYQSGKMPDYIYFQLYATDDEIARHLDDFHKAIGEKVRAEKERRQMTEQTQQDIQKQAQKIITEQIADILKGI